MSRTRRDRYSKRFAAKQEELAIIDAQIEETSDLMKEKKLEARAERLLDDIEELEKKLKELDDDDPDQNVRDRSLEKTFRKIDFHESKSIAEALKLQFKDCGGSALLFLQQSKTHKGNYCIEEVVNIILRDQIIEGQIAGDYRPVLIDFSSAISKCNEEELLIRIAGYLKIDTETSTETLIRAIHQTICSSMSDGSTVYLQIKSLDSLVEQEKFISWFLEEFWQPLAEDFALVAARNRCKLIVALIADGRVLQHCAPPYFCAMDCYSSSKMLELPLSNWTIGDIRHWLTYFRPRGPRFSNLEQLGIDELAASIYRGSNGIPAVLCQEIQDLFS
ncbi:MAG: hypothetical protein WBA10_21405 [Elainellaceae cyanobacterium]